MKALAGFVPASTPCLRLSGSFVFQIFIGVINVNAPLRAQMNTNFAMLPISAALVHTGKFDELDINAEKRGRMLRFWANCRGGLNWY